MSKELLQIYKKFQNMWVALDSNKEEVLAYGISIVEVEKKLKKKNLIAHEVKYILPIDRYFAPTSQ